MEVSLHSQPATSVPAGTREPLLVYLHGLGEIGGNRVEQVEKHGPWRHVRSLVDGYHADTRAEIARFHVLGFHLERGDWDGAQLNDRLQAYIADRPEVDSERLSLTGASLGGRGVLRLTLARPRISALAAFCPAGGASEYSESDIERFRSVPIYFFGCPLDETVPFGGTQALQARIGAHSSRLRAVKGDELGFPSSPHVCWSYVYGHPGLYRWLLNPPRDPGSWPDLAPLPYASKPN